ncbi:MAG TPA: ferritin-like domain-containing protein [Polyangiaceae bacterium]
MSQSEQLIRTLLALASGALAGAAAPGCNGQSIPTGDEGGGAGESTQSGGTSGSGGASGGAPSGGTSSGGTGSGGTGGLSCSDGPVVELCKTLDELEEYVANYPSLSGPSPRPEYTECPARAEIWDPWTCCNPASSGPEQRGEVCCYAFCRSGSCCGRAFSAGDGPRVAATAARRDWLLVSPGEGAPEGFGELTARDAGAIGELWLRDAQMEHASIASFARFTLELLALGAPATLLEGAQRATLDEVEHARLCFGVAARFLRAPVGPAALDLSGAEPRTSLAAAAAAAALEGCVGETIAALVAAEQRARCKDESIARVLERIADDEARHAALAFDFVAWALSVGGSEIRGAVERAVAQGIARAAEGPATCRSPVPETVLNRHGRLSVDTERRVALRAIEDVIAPAVRKLFSSDVAVALS